MATQPQFGYRVKVVDFHPEEPWLLIAGFSGRAVICNCETGSVVKSVQVSSYPVRAGKFVARKNWLWLAADDNLVYVVDYRSLAKVKIFKGHSDYIRWFEIHPTLPYVISASDDFTIKVWNWDRNFECLRVLRHSHYVMQVKINPSDTSTFASASLDRTVRIWSLGTDVPDVLEGHGRGVNCVEYYPTDSWPYLVSGGDDWSVIVWNYKMKSVVHKLTGHRHNVNAVLFHPELPVLMSGSQDGIVCLWHGATFAPEAVLNCRKDSVWALAAPRNSNSIAVASNEGCVHLDLGECIAVTGDGVSEKNGESLIIPSGDASPDVLHWWTMDVKENVDDLDLESQVVDLDCDPLIQQHSRALHIRPSRMEPMFTSTCKKSFCTGFFPASLVLSFFLVFQGPNGLMFYLAWNFLVVFFFYLSCAENAIVRDGVDIIEVGNSGAIELGNIGVIELGNIDVVELATDTLRRRC